MDANPCGCPTNQYTKRTLEFHLNENLKYFLSLKGVVAGPGKNGNTFFFFFPFFSLFDCQFFNAFPPILIFPSKA